MTMATGQYRTDYAPGLRVEWLRRWELDGTANGDSVYVYRDRPPGKTPCPPLATVKRARHYRGNPGNWVVIYAAESEPNRPCRPTIDRARFTVERKYPAIVVNVFAGPLCLGVVYYSDRRWIAKPAPVTRERERVTHWDAVAELLREGGFNPKVAPAGWVDLERAIAWHKQGEIIA